MDKYYKIYVSILDNEFRDSIVKPLWTSLKLTEDNFHLINGDNLSNEVKVREMTKEEALLFKMYRIISSEKAWINQFDSFITLDEIEFSNKQKEAYKIFDTW